jgi:uncharacterized membrane-anchored protein YhcB (DUF1043 family)
MIATNMKQTVKTVALTFGVMSVLSLIVLGLEAHDQAKREAELRKLCNQLNQYRSSMKQEVNKASRIELMGGMYTQSLYEVNCQHIGK